MKTIKDMWSKVLFIIFTFKAVCAHKLYSKNFFSNEEWPRLLYKEIQFPVLSRMECLGLCRAESNLCSGIIWQGSDCFLGDPTSQFSVISVPQASDQNMFIDQGIISSFLSSYMHLVDSIVNHWNARIYSTLPKGSIFKCALQCKSDLNCRLFTFDGDICHLGNGTTYNNTLLPISNPPEGVYVDPGFINGNSSFQLLNEGNPSWTNHVYYSKACNLMERCELWCSLESSPCQFLVYTGLWCYLGTTNVQNAPVNHTHEIAAPDIWINKKGIESTLYGNVFEENITSIKYAPFLFKTRDAEDFQQSCEFYCAFQSNPDCHFFILSDEICYLGNLNEILPSVSSSTNMEVVQMFRNTLNTSLGEFITIQLPHHIWRVRMHTQFQIDSNVGACAIRCVLMELSKECTLFVYDGTTCYLGSKNYLENVDTVHDISDVQVHESVLPFMRTLFKPRTTTDWSSQMYNKVSLINASPRDEDECLLRCFFDDGPCYSFVIQGSECFLGDPFVNSSLFIETGTHVLMERNPKLHIIHGGRVNGSDDKSAAIFEGFFGFCGQSLPDLPVPLSSMGYAYGENAIFVCGGISNGIGAQDKCYRLDFKVFPRTWAPLPSLMNTQVMFPMIYHEGILYAMGGLIDGSTVVPNMRYLNLESSLSWVNGAANSGFFGHCGLLYQNQIYTFGGSSTLEPYSRSVEIYDILSDNWLNSGFLLPQGLRHMACSLVLGQRDTLPDLFLLAGGETALGEYSMKAYSIDPSVSGIVTEMVDLPMGVSQFGSQNSFAVFHETSVFLVVGFGNESHSTKSIFGWNRWSTKFSPLFDQALAREQPGNTMIPLCNFPACSQQHRRWKYVINHVKPFRYPIDGWNLNVLQTGHPGHSQFDVINNYTFDGQYHFRLVYPELGTYNEWYQTSNPLNGSHTSTTGFIGVALGMPVGFNGLVYNNVDALVMGDSNITHPNWFSVGRIKNDSPSGEFPGPQNTLVSSVQLFIRDDCATST
ncbi:hypothetical protein TCAL_08066 [Tigriopus californicus]|uniref:Apple domain-containing protein n=1 Tax=Tigriopus californicus TaxID=6832 RepID=A0A553NU92_TIGCA|nr:uncharacterized protein LOC131889704 isoform X2 [Tigriopus californicus]TRY68998.1 hypothetical protein TCAL_08066 [Tigriopus californicus]